MKKYSDIITAVLFCTVIAVLSVAFILMPDRAFSAQENRSLEQFPDINADTFFSGELAERVNLYFSDQFPLRDMFVKIKSASELMFLKGENNGVLYSCDQLAVKDFDFRVSTIEVLADTDRIDKSVVESRIENVNKLSESLEIPLITVVPPRTVDIADSVFGYDRPDGDIVFDIIDKTLSEKSGFVNTLKPLRERYEKGEYVYYRTDHHWTTLGAYYTYCDIMKRLGREDGIIHKDEFDIEKIDNFSGTTAARASFPFYKKDTLEIWHLPDDSEYHVTADEKTLDGFYERKHLETSDKYSVFLDGTHSVTEISKEGKDRKTLLVVKDSFANCLIPFLAREYDIIALDLKSNLDISSAVAEYGADAVLIVYNTENLITTNDLKKIR